MLWGAHFPTGYSKAIKGNYKATTAAKAITATEDTECRNEFPLKYIFNLFNVGLLYNNGIAKLYS